MDKDKDTAVEAILEQLIETGPTDIASVFARAFELAIQIERERFLGAGRYERTPERQGYANGFKPQRCVSAARGSIKPIMLPAIAPVESLSPPCRTAI